VIGWIGTIASVIGAFVVASKIYTLGYIFFLVGAACWLFVAWRNRDASLGVLNGFFLCANLLGLVNTL